MSDGRCLAIRGVVPRPEIDADNFGNVDHRTSLTGTSAALPSAGVQRRNYRPPAPTLTSLLEAAAVEPDVDGSPLGRGQRSVDPRRIAAGGGTGGPMGARHRRTAATTAATGCSTGRRRGRFPRATSVGGRSGSPFVLRVSHQDEQSLHAVGWRRRRHSVAQRTTLPATTGPAMRSSRRSNSLRSAAARDATAVAHRSPGLEPRARRTTEVRHQHAVVVRSPPLDPSTTHLPGRARRVGYAVALGGSKTKSSNRVCRVSMRTGGTRRTGVGRSEMWRDTAGITWGT